jgi:hypothetical protein
MELSLRLTALTLLLRPMGPIGVRATILGLAVLALVVPRVLVSPFTWGALTLLIVWRIAWDWPLADNHIYLLAYWCLAIALALARPDARALLPVAAASLLGVAFAMAVLWKALLSPDFLDGRFFRVTLLTDERFIPLITTVGGLQSAEVDRNREILAPLPEGAELLDPPALIEPPSFERLVWASTAGILALETFIAAACLALAAGAPATPAHVLLLLFCVVTYAFAPVAGFGWLLLSIGSAFTRVNQHRMRAAYVATWLVVLAYAELRV